MQAGQSWGEQHLPYSWSYRPLPTPLALVFAFAAAPPFGFGTVVLALALALAEEADLRPGALGTATSSGIPPVVSARGVFLPPFPQPIASN